MWGPQRPKFWILAEDFGFWGFWILDLADFGFWILGILDFGFWGFWILDLGDFGFWGRNPKSKIPDPKCKIQTFLADFGDFGFWILDRYVANLYVRPPTPQIWGILDFGLGGFWILDLGISDFGFWILGILDFGFWGFWILDFGPLCSKSLCEAPNAPNLGDFGFWGFWGFWILDFGDFGFWILGILDFGFWTLGILDFGFCDKFWILHKKKKTVHADPGRRIFIIHPESNNDQYQPGVAITFFFKRMIPVVAVYHIATVVQFETPNRGLQAPSLQLEAVLRNHRWALRGSS